MPSMSLSSLVKGQRPTTWPTAVPAGQDFGLLPLPTPNASTNTTATVHVVVENESAFEDQISIKNGYSLKRYPIRSALLAIVPPLLAAYFIVISTVFVTDNAETSRYSHRNALVVYYSWFIVGVFGLGISRYGLAGIEAAMLQDRFWHANNAMTLLMHSGQSWSEFGGLIKYLFVHRKTKNPMQPLWWLLACLSLMVMIALPLSGLTIELFDGFVNARNAALVIGRTRENYLARDRTRVYNNGYPKWQSGGSLRVPGAGVIYTPPHVERQNYTSLKSMSNSLPSGENAPDMFLTPQAEYPVSGRIAWGLRLSYNCSVAVSGSQLTILSRRRSSFNIAPNVKPNQAIRLRPTDSRREVIYTVSQNGIANLVPYIEFGYSYQDDYYLGVNDTEGNPGTDVSTVLEYALWQLRVGRGHQVFDNKTTAVVTDLGSPFERNATGHIVHNLSFFDLPGEPASPPLRGLVNLTRLEPLEYTGPIAVRCTQFSQTGTASLSPDTMTFTNFTPIPPAPPPKRIRETRWLKPLGDTAYSLFHDSNIEKPALDDLFLSSMTPSVSATTDGTIYTHYLSNSDLHEPITHAYAVNALELMYDGIEDFQDAIQDAYPDPNLSASHPGKIIGRGVVPTEIPSVQFCIWAVGCTVLAVRYGFSRRWAETLDGYRFLRFGADHADVVRRDLHREFYHSEYLQHVPGLVGGSRVDEGVGHVSLVQRGGWMGRNKLYC